MTVDIELTQRFNLVAKKFQARWERCLPRIKIDNSAADCELSARCDLSYAFITGPGELFEDAFHLLICPASKLNEGGLECAASWSSLIEAGAGGDDQLRRLLALKLREQRKPFSRDLGVWQDIFDRSEFHLRQKKRVRLPVKQTFIEQFLGMDAGTKDPNRVFDLGRDSGD